jgi:REP element-mobilizing transposase RayT
MPIILFIHLTWATFRRMPMIGPTEARFLRRFLPSEAQRHGAAIIAMGMVCDHVHLVLRLPGRFDLPRLVQGLKGASARLANQDNRISLAGLRWAHGYHLISVSPRNLRVAVQYVRRQAQRHPDRAIEMGPRRGVPRDASRSAERRVYSSNGEEGPNVKD